MGERDFVLRTFYFYFLFTSTQQDGILAASDFTSNERTEREREKSVCMSRSEASK